MPVSQARADATRQTLFDVTGDILATEGYAALSEGYLCAQSGVTRGALRYHFPAGRYDLLPAFATSVVERQAQRLEALGNLPARERLYLVLMSMRDMPPSAPTVALLELWMACRGDRKLADLMAPIMDQALNQVLGAAADADDPEILAIRIIVHGASMLSFSPDFSAQRLKGAIAWLLEKLPPPPELQERLRAVNTRRCK